MLKNRQQCYDEIFTIYSMQVTDCWNCLSLSKGISDQSNTFSANNPVDLPVCNYTYNPITPLLYRILPITGASPNKSAPLVWGTQYFAEGLK